MTAHEGQIDQATRTVEEILDAQTHDDLCACASWPTTCVTYGDTRPWSHSDVSRIVTATFAVFEQMQATTVPAGAQLDALLEDVAAVHGDETGTLVPIDRVRDALVAASQEQEVTTEYAYGTLGTDVIISTGEDIDDLGAARWHAEEMWLSVLQRTVTRGPWMPAPAEGMTS